jgi:hypothetical protein
MVDLRVGLIIYRSDPITAVNHIQQYASQLTNESHLIPSVPNLPSWVIVCFAHLIPESSPLSVPAILHYTKSDVRWAYWWHTPETWRMAVMMGNETLGRQIHRPPQYKEEPPEDLLVHPFSTKIELMEVLSTLGSDTHRLYNNIEPTKVMYSLVDDEPMMLARLFRYHYWDLMQFVLPHRWDLVEYLMHAFQWTSGEFGTVLETLPRSPLFQPPYTWMEFWCASEMFRIPLVSLIKRRDPAWFTTVWWRTYGIRDWAYAISVLDCWQLQESCTSEELDYVFGLPSIDWVQGTGMNNVDKIQSFIREKRFRIQFR